MKYHGFCGPSYTSPSGFYDCERLINFYVEKGESEGVRDQEALFPTPGVQTFAAAVESSIRGMFAMEGRAWVIANGTLYELSSGKVLTSRGAVLIDGNPATITINADSAHQNFITSGYQGYILDRTTNVLTAVVANATMGGMLDSFFLRFDGLTSTVGVSASLDGTTWDPTQIFQRTSAPDPWLSMIIANKKIYLLGEQTSEVWYDKGSFPIPFAPIASALIPYGIAAPFSAAERNGAVLWLSNKRAGSYQIVSASGYSSADRVSNDAVEARIATYSRVDDAEAFIFTMLGHDFYVLNFPSANATWAHDASTGWFELGTWNIAANRYDAWHPRNHINAFGKHLVGDRVSGTIYQLDPSFGLDAGAAPIRRVRIAPSLGRDLRRPGRARPVIVDRFSVQLEGGLGVSSGQGSDPQILFAKSTDGGKTFGNFQSRSAGAIGVYNAIPTWGRVGQALDFVPQVVMTDPIPWRIVGADIQLRGAAA